MTNNESVLLFLGFFILGIVLSFSIFYFLCLKREEFGSDFALLLSCVITGFILMVPSAMVLRNTPTIKQEVLRDKETASLMAIAYALIVLMNTSIAIIGMIRGKRKAEYIKD